MDNMVVLGQTSCTACKAASCLQETLFVQEMVFVQETFFAQEKMRQTNARVGTCVKQQNESEGQSGPKFDAFAAHTRRLCRKAFHIQTA